MWLCIIFSHTYVCGISSMYYMFVYLFKYVHGLVTVNEKQNRGTKEFILTLFIVLINYLSTGTC